VRFLTSTTGAVGNTYQFDAFGMPIASTGTTANTYLYSAERLDSSTNLYQLRARFYNMLTGRFETMDPAAGNIFDPGTLHKYIYTRNDPIDLADPAGEDDIDEYAVLRAMYAGQGLQAHHIIPQRFAQTLGAAYCTIAVELAPGYHQVLTNLWQGVLPYGGTYTAAQIFAAAEEVYWGPPEHGCGCKSMCRPRWTVRGRTTR
jgi:RHS repeat-associated protein